MEARPTTSALSPTPLAWLWAVRALGVVAFGLSVYLLMGSLTGDRLPGCGLESGCGAVLGSRWAYWFGVPVSLFAALAYAALLAATVGLMRWQSYNWQQRIRFFLTAAAGAIVGAALWFVSLQAAVIKAFCPFCMAVHACGLLMGILILAGLRPRKPAAAGRRSARSTSSPTPVATGRGVFVGLGATLVLVFGQVIHRPDTFRVDLAAGGRILRADSRPGSLATSGRPPERIVRLHGGSIALDLRQLPIMGSPEAPHVVVHLFDYSCSHCRELHPILVEAGRQLSNQLVIVSLPVPLSTNCNRLIRRVMAQHVNACEYARIGLAVWHAQADKLAAFDDWFFSPALPPSPESVRAQAMRLVGTNELHAALRDPWVDEQVQLGVRVQEGNYRKYRRSQLPQLLIGTNLVTGVVPTVDRLKQLLTNQFDLR